MAVGRAGGLGCLAWLVVVSLVPGVVGGPAAGSASLRRSSNGLVPRVAGSRQRAIELVRSAVGRPLVSHEFGGSTAGRARPAGQGMVCAVVGIPLRGCAGGVLR